MYTLCVFLIQVQHNNCFCYSVWMCCIQLELLLFGGQQALQTCKHILRVWQNKYGGLDER